ncbi:hypothetical protein [Thiocapsa sp.]|uniref:hypothetical protein n=1 Tax=Thiocapsa sp. TaxID=2024551 RepID=UPI002619CED4|nr:hypothetical protein [Thiocapsa sp.]
MVAKRGELAGHVEQCRREVQRLAEELTHLDATIRLFDPDYDVGAVQSKGPRHRHRHRLRGYGLPRYGLSPYC